MNKKDRARIDRAIKEGEAARAEGKRISENPYKISNYGVGSFWSLGWQRENDRINYQEQKPE